MTEYDYDDDLDDDLDDGLGGTVQKDYGPRRTNLTINVYRDRDCTDLVTVVSLLAGADVLTLSGPCTLRFNEAEGR